MTVTVGRVREDPLFDVKLVAMGHNTIRGAAGGSVLNAELLALARPALPPRMIVCKFGGTSVGDAEAIERAAGIVARTRAATAARRRVGARRRDERAARTRRAGGDGAADRRACARVEALRERHLRSRRRLLGDWRRRRGDLRRSSARCSTSSPRSPRRSRRSAHLTPRSLDAIAAIGRAAVVACSCVAAFRARGIPASTSTRGTVMITDDQFTRAEPQPGRDRRARAAQVILPLLRARAGAGDGRLHRRHASTASRRRSAAAAPTTARRWSARRCRPRRSRSGPTSTACSPPIRASCPTRGSSSGSASTRRRELASFGAKVLHPSTIAPAVRLGIPVYVLQLAAARGHGHAHHLRRAAAPGDARSPARAGVTLVKVRSPRMLLAHGFLRALFEIFERHRTSVDVVATSEVSRVASRIDDAAHLEALVVDLRAARRRVGRAQPRHRRASSAPGSATTATRWRARWPRSATCACTCCR